MMGDWSPASGATYPRNGSPMEDSEKAQKFTGMPSEANGDHGAPSTGPPQDNFGLHARGSSSDPLRLIPAPDSPALPARLPSSPSFRISFRHLFHPLISTALHLGPRLRVSGSTAFFLTFGYTDSASGGGIAGRIWKRR